jgi:hypothetical protein
VGANKSWTKMEVSEPITKEERASRKLKVRRASEDKLKRPN